MKRILVAATIVLGSVSAVIAQTPKIVNLIKHINFNQPVAATLPHQPLKPTGIRSVDSSRLTGIAYYNYDTSYTVADSEAFSYAGSNGGTVSDYFGGSFIVMKFTDQNSYVYNQGNKTFGDDTLTEQTFNANDLVDTSLTLLYNKTSKTWVNYALSIYTYASNNIPSSEYDYNWTGTAWQPADNAQVTFVDGNIASVVIQEYDTATSKYVNYAQLNYSYNLNNAIDTELVQEWNGAKWINYERQLYLYDSFNNDTSLVIQEYGSSWGDVDKDVYNYGGTSLVESSYELGYSGKGWDSLYQYFYSYDANNNDTTIAAQNFYKGEWIQDIKLNYTYNGYNQPTSYIYSNYTGTMYTPAAKQLYYYEQYLAGINQLTTSNSQLAVYPNPTNGEVTISSAKNIDDIIITNPLGQTVLKSSSQNPGVKQTIDLSNLSGGMYFVTVKSGNNIETQKIIVSR